MKRRELPSNVVELDAYRRRRDDDLCGFVRADDGRTLLAVDPDYALIDGDDGAYVTVFSGDPPNRTVLASFRLPGVAAAAIARKLRAALAWGADG